MAIVNRSLDSSEQIVEMSQAFNSEIVTGSTLHCFLIPSASVLKKVSMEGLGQSGSPTYSLRIQRFIVGAGATVIDPTGNADLTLDSVLGTSGYQSFSLLASGNTLLNLMSGDVITLTSGTADTSVLQAAVAAVIQYTQDIKSTLGV